MYEENRNIYVYYGSILTDDGKSTKEIRQTIAVTKTY